MNTNTKDYWIEFLTVVLFLLFIGVDLFFAIMNWKVYQMIGTVYNLWACCFASAGILFMIGMLVWIMKMNSEYKKD